MSVADKLETLLVIKDSIKDAIIEKGVDVSDDDAFTTYADKILLIEGGGDSNNWSLVEGYWGYNEPTTYGTYKILSLGDYIPSIIKCRFRGDITFCCSSSGILNVSDLDKRLTKYTFKNNTANISYSPLDNEEHFVYFEAPTGQAVIYIKGFHVVEQEYIEFLSEYGRVDLCGEYEVIPINDSKPYHYKVYILDTFGTTSLFNTEEMFYGTGITSLISFPTTKYITNMDRMFYGTTITNLDLSNWDLSNVKYMREMFRYSDLQHFDLSNRTLPNLALIDFICYDSNIITANLSNSDLRNIKTASGLFTGCNKLQYIDISNCDMRSATDFSLDSNTDVGLPELIYVNLDNSNFSSTSDLFAWFISYSKLNSVSMRNADFRSAESTADCFYWSDSIVNIDLSGSNFSSNIDGERMFSDCRILKTINLSNADFRSLKYMNYFYLGCYELETIDTTNVNFSSVEDMGYAYSNLQKMLEIDLSYITSPNVKGMYGTFYDCENLEIVNMLNFIFKNVVLAHSLFERCPKLTTILGIDNLDASSLVDALEMFANCESLTGDIVMHNTDSLEDMRDMFSYCKKLESITFTGNLDNVKYFDDLCWLCTNLRYMKMMGKPPQCSIPANALYTDVKHSKIFYYNSDYDYSALIAEAINSGWTVIAI